VLRSKHHITPIIRLQNINHKHSLVCDSSHVATVSLLQLLLHSLLPCRNVTNYAWHLATSESRSQMLGVAKLRHKYTEIQDL